VLEAGPHASQSALSAFTAVWGVVMGLTVITIGATALVTLRSHAELSAGYTTTPFAYPEVDLVDARTGVILRAAGEPLIDKKTFLARRAQARLLTNTVDTRPPAVTPTAVTRSDNSPLPPQPRELDVSAPLPFKVFSSQPHRLILLGVFFGAVALLATLGISAASLVRDAQDREHVITPIVIVAIVLLITGLSFFGLLTRSDSRNQLLERRFPDAFVATIGKTDDLSTQLVILNGPTQQSGVPSELLANYSSLVVDTSGIAIWIGSASSPTRTFAVPASAVMEVSATQGQGGALLRVIVKKETVPVTLLMPAFRLGLVRFFAMSISDVDGLAAQAQLKLDA
jgi:hypothetical protein